MHPAPPALLASNIDAWRNPHQPLDRFPRLRLRPSRDGAYLRAPPRPGQDPLHLHSRHHPLGCRRPRFRTLHLPHHGRRERDPISRRLRHRRVALDRQPLRLSYPLPRLQHRTRPSAQGPLLGSRRRDRYARGLHRRRPGPSRPLRMGQLHLRRHPADRRHPSRPALDPKGRDHAPMDQMARPRPPRQSPSGQVLRPRR